MRIMVKNIDDDSLQVIEASELYWDEMNMKQKALFASIQFTSMICIIKASLMQ